MKIKKEDLVLVISGKYRGKRGRVLKALPQKKKLIVEGINLVKKHIRPKREGEKGQIITFPAPIDVSNVKLICPKCRKATRIGYEFLSQKNTKRSRQKVRICKKCKKPID